MVDQNTKNERHEDWRHWLAGGFAFMDAPFGGHPLDDRRARKMVFAAMRDGASIDDIKEAAVAYLEERSWNPATIPSQIQRVEKYLKSFKPAKRKKSAWLLTWEYANDDRRPISDRVIAIRDGRMSSEKIKEFVEQTYIASLYSLDEKMHYSSHAKDNPYPAVYGMHPKGGRCLAKMTCGHNPFIMARVVRDLRLYNDKEGDEALTWQELPVTI